MNKVQPFEKITKLWTGSEERVLAIDPDFCHWQVPDKILTSVPNLKAVCLKTTSFSWINTTLAKERGIVVTNNRGWAAEAVVEWILMTSLFLARKMPLMVHEGWKKDLNRYRGVELQGKIAGILGLGRLGKRLAEVASSLGMKVVYWSKNSRDKRYTLASIEKIITTADFIYPVWSNNPETQKLLPKNLLVKTNPTGFFIDIYIAQESHDKKILINMAEKGKIAGYGFEAESEEFNKYKGNVAAIPENAWTTCEAVLRNGDQWTTVIIKATQGSFPNRVN